jgi:AraC-like DNA-binding protein
MRITREPIPHAEQSLRCLHLALPAFRGGLHRHGHFELTWIERGHGLRWVGDSVEPFFDGDLVLVGSETPHLWSSHGTPTPRGCTATVLQFPPDWLQRCGLPELRPVWPLLLRVAQGVEILGPTRAAIQGLLASLPGASDVRRVAAFIEVLACLLVGEADLRALSTPWPPALGDGARRGGAGRPPGQRRIDRVLSWIESHLGDELCIADAAAIANISAPAFGRFFQREVGKGFTAYVNDARCSWAALRLIGSADTVAQVAQSCGFPTLSNFGEQFRRRYGVGPREFRAQGLPGAG